MSRANKRLTLLENNKFAYSCFKVLKHLPLWKICEKMTHFIILIFLFRLFVMNKNSNATCLFWLPDLQFFRWLFFYLLAATPHEASRGYFNFKEKLKKYVLFLEAIYRILVNLSSLKKENRIRPVLRKFFCYT